MERYRIIDEPRSKPWGEKLIVDPTIILLAAILVPLFWNPPYFGRFWLPALWLIINGYALGSSTLGKEIATIVGGLFLAWAVLWLTSVVRKANPDLSIEAFLPYTRLLLFGVFFLTLYLVVFKQGRSYQLFKYVRGGD
ncbi:MAG: hypothetical protein QNJ19_03525 [Woeseiaceae bacterium]|nr:hypothetical protein [Woeseiaceae bacterium]